MLLRSNNCYTPLSIRLCSVSSVTTFLQLHHQSVGVHGLCLDIISATLSSHNNLVHAIRFVMQASEFGEAEVWMNERLMRSRGRSCAEFIAAFQQEGSSKVDPLWIIWKYEGDYTLWDLMQKKNFPYNLEPLLLKKELDMPEGKC